jgi:2-polyprenyl-3-methyl-5-hydroxy-6-metoxy-1,4-benzoquinol methylase
MKMKDEFSLEARFYDKIWGRHDYDADVKFLADFFRKHHCRSVIDIGCGTGNHALRLSKMGYQVTGVDVSPTMLKIAKAKDKEAKIRFIQGDMKKLEKVISKGQRFDAGICLGQVFSHLMTDKDVQAFLNRLHKILKQNGLFVFSARNAKKINEEYLNKLRLDHMLNEEKLQLLMLGHNIRDSQDPNIIVWNPIYIIKENSKVDLQIREHKLRWFEFSTLKKIITKNGFKIVTIYSGPMKEKFKEDEHTDMWFVTTAT